MQHNQGQEWEDSFREDKKFDPQSDDPGIKRIIAAAQRAQTLEPELFELLESAQEGGLLTVRQFFLATQHVLIGDVIEDILDERYQNGDRTPISMDEIREWSLDMLETVVSNPKGEFKHSYAEGNPDVNLNKLWNAAKQLKLDNKLLFQALYIPELYASIVSRAEGH